MRKAWVAIALLALAGVALAEISYDSNRVLMTAPANALGSPLSSADSSALDTPIRPRQTLGNSKVIVSPSLSSFGATCCLKVILYQRAAGKIDTYETIAAVQTFTADCPSTDTIGGRFTSRDGFLLAPTLGCQVFDVRVEAISAGNVTWRAWPLGSDTAPSSNANE